MSLSFSEPCISIPSVKRAMLNNHVAKLLKRKVNGSIRVIQTHVHRSAPIHPIGCHILITVLLINSNNYMM